MQEEEREVQWSEKREEEREEKGERGEGVEERVW